MTADDRVPAVARFGFTLRQARFLVTVMRHAGVCLPRQQNLKRHLKDRTPKTVNNVLTVLNVLLKKAVEKPSAGFYDFDDYERLGLVAAAKAKEPAAYLIVLLGGDRGLRCGEIIALEWSDVDLGKQQLCVQRSEWRGHVTAPKGGRSRYVPRTARLASALREYVLFALGDARRAGSRDSGTGRTPGPDDHAAVHAPERGGD